MVHNVKRKRLQKRDDIDGVYDDTLADSEGEQKKRKKKGHTWVSLCGTMSLTVTPRVKEKLQNIVQNPPRFSGMCSFVVTSSAHSLTKRPRRTSTAFPPQLHCQLLVITVILHVLTRCANTDADAKVMRNNTMRNH